MKLNEIATCFFCTGEMLFSTTISRAIANDNLMIGMKICELCNEYLESRREEFVEAL